MGIAKVLCGWGLGLVSVSAFAVNPMFPNSGQATDVPTPRLVAIGQPDPRFLQLHDQYKARAKQGPIGVLFLGDSITEGWAWVPDFFNARYGAHSPANFGIAGDATQHMLWRIMNGELDGNKPQVVVLMAGTNNVDRSTADIARGITKLVDTIRRKSPATKVLLLGIFPRGLDPKDPGVAKLRTRIEEVNRNISKLDDGEHIRYLDIGAKFLAPDGKIPATLMPDALHPNAQGYQVWADAMQPLFDEMIQSND